MPPHIESEDHLSFYTRWNALAGPYFKWQLSQFEPYLGRRIADLGCGVGNFAQFLLDRDLYLGLDLDPEMIEYMRFKYAPERCPNVEIAHADIVSSDCLRILKEKNIDTILSVNVIEHIEDDTCAIKLMVDALPKGGTLCLLVPAFGQLYGTLDRLDNHFRRYTKSLYVNNLHLFAYPAMFPLVWLTLLSKRGEEWQRFSRGKYLTYSGRRWNP